MISSLVDDKQRARTCGVVGRPENVRLGLSGESNSENCLMSRVMCVRLSQRSSRSYWLG